MSETIKKGLREHELSFSPMDWPPRSPDVNLIENLWGKTLYSCSTIPSSIQEKKNAGIAHDATENVCCN